MLNKLVNHRKKKFSKKRLGRGTGSGTGKTSGRGHKGQKSRSGVSLQGFEGGQMPIHRRLPKRGFVNIFKKKFNTINLIQLESLLNKKVLDAKDEITEELLLKKKFFKKKLNGLKILGNGEIKLKLNLKALKASKSAIKKVEKAGGKIDLLENIKKNNIKKQPEEIKE